ncbi:MAG: replication initiator protein A [Nitrososphaerota archaeon]|nr:replication initiator protein A [Nitrososphaerota archaeon]
MPWFLIKDEQFKTLSSDAKILYSLLLNRISLSKKNGWCDEFNRVYLIYTVDEVMGDLNCGKNKAIALMQELNKKGLVESIRRGLGKPNILYVKNFATSLKYSAKDNDVPETPMDSQKFDFQTSRGLKIKLQEVGFSNLTNTYLNNTDSSKSKSKSDTTTTNDSEAHKEIQEPTKEKGVSKREVAPDTYTTYRAILQKNINYSHYVAHRPRDIMMVDDLIDCMLDVICTEEPIVKINGEDKKREMVKSQYLRVNSEDVDHILIKYREQYHRITHVHSYLKTMLYTVKQEIGAYYENAVRVDGIVR